MAVGDGVWVGSQWGRGTGVDGTAVGSRGRLAVAVAGWVLVAVAVRVGRMPGRVGPAVGGGHWPGSERGVGVGIPGRRGRLTVRPS
jgi:hypothetical protein